MRCRWLTLSLLLWSALGSAQVPVALLTLMTAQPIDGPPGLQPSGLTVCRGELLMVSDRHDDSLFALREREGRLQAERWMALRDVPPAPDPGFPAEVDLLLNLQGELLRRRYDWEGLTCDADGNLYLASEAKTAILKIDPAGRFSWLGAGLYGVGREIGLFGNSSGLIEGIAWGQGRLWVAAERERRGLIRLVAEGQDWRIDTPMVLAPTPGLDPERSSDLSGLWWEGERLYTLERNQSAVCRRHPDNLQVERCWRYSDVEWSEEIGYRAVRYGLGEGVARSGDLLYVVLDNNDRPRRLDPEDRRPQLLRFRLPDDWQAIGP